MDILNSSNLTLLENSTNSTEAFQTTYLINHGCDPTIDQIVNESGRFMCYHQATTMEAIKIYWPYLIILIIAAWYIGNKGTTYIIKKHIKKQ